MQALQSQADIKPFFGVGLLYTLFKPRIVSGIRYENMQYHSTVAPTKHVANSIKCRTMSQVTDIKSANIKPDIEGLPPAVFAGILVSP
jgi:outer membrane protein W